MVGYIIKRIVAASLDRFEKLLLGPVKYYRRRGARIGEIGLFSWPQLAEPHLCEIGDNVWITAGCVFLNHDGSIAMLNRAGRTQAVNVVGKIMVHENVFIGTRSIIMGSVEIGPNAIVAAGSVVTHDVFPETVVGGCPARMICTLEEYLNKYHQPEQALFATDEAHIRDTVIDCFMHEKNIGKRTLFVRHGKTRLTM